ncbi:hypothetical protein ACOME3_005050 [Neoechinorhynchus agilis]
MSNEPSLSHGERAVVKSTKEVSQNKSRRVIVSDKGGKLVVIGRSVEERMMSTLLGDWTTYDLTANDYSEERREEFRPSQNVIDRRQLRGFSAYIRVPEMLKGPHHRDNWIIVKVQADYIRSERQWSSSPKTVSYDPKSTPPNDKGIY